MNNSSVTRSSKENADYEIVLCHVSRLNLKNRRRRKNLNTEIKKKQVNMNLFGSSRALNKLKYSSDRTFKEKLEIIFIKDHRQGNNIIQLVFKS